MSLDTHSTPAGVKDPNSDKAGETITTPVSRFFSRYLSKVELTPEYERALQGLSEKGVVIYALKYPSRLNCLILHDLGLRKNIPQPLLCHGMGSLFWRPAAKIVRSLLARPADPGCTGDLDRLTRLRKSSVIYLRGSESDSSADPLVQLLNAQKTLDVPVYIVPMAVTYGPRREKKERPLVEIFFGDQENPGWLRRLIAFIRYQNRTSVIVAEPTDLSHLLKAAGERSSSELASGLRGELIGRIDHDKTAALGPRIKAREEIMAMAQKHERGIGALTDAVDGPEHHLARVRFLNAAEIAGSHKDVSTPRSIIFSVSMGLSVKALGLHLFSSNSMISFRLVSIILPAPQTSILEVLPFQD
jgi:hypothetical protein